MIGKKLGAIVLVLAVLAAYQINSFYTPEGFERPYVFKLFSGLCALSCSLSRAVDRLGLLNEAHAVRAVSHGLMTPNIVDENIVTEDLWVNEVRLRVYKPKSMSKSAKLPIMVFYHGGGYFFKNLNMYDLYLYHFVNHLNMIVVSVDYRYSPEFPFPQPTEDCFMATKYILENGEKFNADITRLVVAGDSAGGNAVGVVTQRLLKEKLPQPKLQLLIYPWTQMIDLTLPSHLYYGEKDLAGPYRTNLCRVVAWYLGVVDNMSEIEDVFSRNEIYSLIDDWDERIRIINCLNVDKIGKEYRSNPEYYKLREIPIQLSSESILKRDDRLAGLFRKLLDPSVSPLLAHKQDLVGLPKAYFIVLEWDSLKDDSLLYAQRLKEAGVDVKVAFYERAYHGSVTIMDKYQFSKDIFADLVKFLKTEL